MEKIMPQTPNDVTSLILSDEEILEKIKGGSAEEFRIIMKKYNQRLYRVALSFDINDFDAEDVLQQTYISAFNNLSQFKGESQFITWLTRILINQCLMYKRTQKNLRKKSEVIAEEFNMKMGLLNENNPEELYMKSELKNILEEIIKMLPEKYKTVYVVREIEGMNTRETAEILNISEENVKIRLFRAKELIKDHLLSNFNKKELLSFGNQRCDRVTDIVMNFIYNQRGEGDKRKLSGTKNN
ncbi:MAG: RNA polymerase sigma factor [Ignavibacteriaceae bacterium]